MDMQHNLRFSGCLMFFFFVVVFFPFLTIVVDKEVMLSSSADPLSQIDIREELQRAVLQIEEQKQRQRLLAAIDEGLIFFATNERFRRTFQLTQTDVNSRAVHAFPKRGEWDYHRYFLSRDEWERKNPYRPGIELPGMQTSTIENPAQEFAVKALQRQVNVAIETEKSVEWNEALQCLHDLRTLQIAEKSCRSALCDTALDFWELLVSTTRPVVV